jgi:hypothetical protein
MTVASSPGVVNGRLADSVGPLGPWLPHRAECLTISPEQARALLEISAKVRRNRNGGRRKIIADSIRKGNWRCNGATVVLGSDQGINDGHNRLGACVDAGVPIKTWVIFGIEPDLFSTNDIDGKPRGAADVLHIQGHEYAALLSSAGGLTARYLSGERSLNITAGPAGNTVDRVQEIEQLSRRGLAASLREAVSLRKDAWFLSDRVSVASHFLFGLADRERRDDFFARLTTGANMEPGDAVLALRNRLMQTRDRSGRAEDGSFLRVKNETLFIQFNVMIRAWNYDCSGRQVAILKVPNRVGKGGRLVPADLPDIAGLDDHRNPD